MEQCDETDANALHALAAHRDVPRADFARSAVRLSTPYNQIFGNLQTTRVTCSVCMHVTEKYDRAHSYELALDDANVGSMQELLVAHLANEHLGTDYSCDACGRRGKCAKRTNVQQWQRVLMINFKRFAFDRIKKQATKIERHIRYPMSYEPVAGIHYQLHAVVVHTGRFGSGHYFAYVRGSDDQWRFCNDSQKPRVVVDAAEVQRQQAYILFYERVTAVQERIIVNLHPNAL